MFNFTWFCDIETNFNWGFSGEGNYSAYGEGVTGLVYKGRYDMSLSNWRHTPNREEFFDFSEAFGSTEKCAMVNLNGPIIDMTFLV